LVRLYWDIGEAIHRKQECNRPKLQPLVREVSWAKNLVIFGRCKDDLEREFYLRATARFGWTRAVLQHQVDNRSYEKYLSNQTTFDQTLSPALRAQAILAVKDFYTFDFLNLAKAHSERTLERALVNNLRRFLAEMGGACAFVGNQRRIEVGGHEYFIDLLLFHRRLRCLIAIDLTIGAFRPEHKGKMEFYLEALDAHPSHNGGTNGSSAPNVIRATHDAVLPSALDELEHTIGRTVYIPSWCRHSWLRQTTIEARSRDVRYRRGDGPRRRYSKVLHGTRIRRTDHNGLCLSRRSARVLRKAPWADSVRTGRFPVTQRFGE
jgi:predicted nuclease of restriction endonuclease-like (RecB) superfamily